jgi:hypothetical protein
MGGITNKKIAGLCSKTIQNPSAKLDERRIHKNYATAS